MNINDQTLHMRVVTVRVTEAEIKKLVAQHIAGHAGVDLHLSNATVTRARITNENSGSITGGPRYAMDMTIEVALDDVNPDILSPALQSVEQAFAKGVL
jgi:hypothetical protein